MLLSEKVKTKSCVYYKDLGYDVSEKYIEVNICDLKKGSNSLVNAQCDYCDNVRDISYKDYNKNISKGGKFSCSVKCGTLKAKENCLNKWGVESTNQLDSVKNKSRETLINKWGVDHVSKIPEVSDIKSLRMKEKSVEISERLRDWWSSLDSEDIHKMNEKRILNTQKKWGVDNISSSDLIKDKKSDTFRNKWGGFTFGSSVLMDKVKATNLEKWGFEVASKSDDIKIKTENTNLEKWGFKSPSMNDLVKNKVRNTNLSKYNVTNIMYSENFRKKFIISNELGYVSYKGNRFYEFLCESCGLNYEIDYDNFYKRSLRKVSTCTLCFPIKENSSIKEVELRNYILSIYSGEVISNYRNGLEIDIYLPEIKLGIEFNGLYWHNDDKLDKNYHLNKLKYFEDKDIQIINVWEDDWDNNREIIKSQIRNLISTPERRIYARNLEVKQIFDTYLVRSFLANNHIQGFIRSTIKLGLFSGDELVSIMTFDTSEGRKKMEEGGWNLSRFCSKINYSIIGGASKLLKHFIKNWKPKRVISFADMDWSRGNLYKKLGFNLNNTLKPDFKYVVDGKRINKQRFSKKRLTKMGYDIELTESTIINSLNIPKVWGCGQLKFQMII